MFSLFTKLRKYILFFVRLNIFRHEPVIIFAPGRVGSMALHKNLIDRGVFAFKLEFMNIGSSGAADFVKKHIFARHKKAKIITIVRDPVTMMVSYFFSKASARHIEAAFIAWKNKDVATLHKIFITEILETDRLDSHLYWYERDFFNATGIDVFAYKFDDAAKHIVIPHEMYPTLILRTEMDDQMKMEAVSEFLNIQPFVLTKANSRSEKQDADLYERFRTTLTLPKTLIAKIYTSKLAMQFLSTHERDAAKRLWQSN